MFEYTIERGVLKYKGRKVLVQVGQDFYELDYFGSLRGRTDEEQVRTRNKRFPDSYVSYILAWFNKMGEPEYSITEDDRGTHIIREDQEITETGHKRDMQEIETFIYWEW